MGLSRKEVHGLLELRTVEWMEEKLYDAFIDLYSNDCNTEEEKELIIDLIKRTVYVSGQEFDNILEKYVKDITSRFQEDETLILATSMDDSPDSSHVVTYQMKPKFSDFGWDNIVIRSKIKKLPTFAEGKKNIIIVDEFIGTGQTMKNRVDTITKQLGQVGITEYKIYIYSIAGTEEGILELMGYAIDDIICDIELERGISDKYNGETLEQKKEMMRRLETLLLPEYGNCVLENVHFGYGGTEILYKRETGNTPNNVFPIFWWKKYLDKTDRKTLMTRRC